MKTAIIGAIVLCGFHIGITLLALYRAWRALQHAGEEGREDGRTLWRLALLRLCAVPAVLSALILGTIVPLLIAGSWFATLSGLENAFAVILTGAWLIWIASTVALDNLARRWTGAKQGNRRPQA